MLLTLTAAASPALPDARDLGFLLQKNPGSVLEKNLSFGIARVFWPEAAETRAICALSVEIDPIGLVRGRADSPVCVCLGSALRRQLVSLRRHFSVLLLGPRRTGERENRADRDAALSLGHTPRAAVRRGETLIRSIFAPLGLERRDRPAPASTLCFRVGRGRSFHGHPFREKTVQELLSHLYVLIPVLDNAKHYGIGDDEVRSCCASARAGWRRIPSAS